MSIAVSGCPTSTCGRGDRCMAARPDLIVLGGDYVTWGDRRYVGAAAEAPVRLSAPHGVFAVLGNHDDDREMPAALEHGRASKSSRCPHAAPRSAANRSTWWAFASGRAGRPTSRHSLRGAVRPGRSAGARSAAPDARPPSSNIPLVLSGHTHGGQVVLPGVGALAARKFPVVSGVARQGDTTIFVSRGVGTVYVPIRLSCPPEVALLTLSARPRRLRA